MEVVPTDRGGWLRIQAWLKVAVCFLGYFGVLKLIQKFEADRFLSYGDARLAMLSFTVVALFLLVTYSTIKSRSLIKAWLGVALCVLAYNAVYIVVKWSVTAHWLAANKAQGILLASVCAMFFAMLVLTFNPYKHVQRKS